MGWGKGKEGERNLRREWKGEKGRGEGDRKAKGRERV
jgi:hypothetical protein